MVALNGPPLKDAMAEGGVVEQALAYFFSRNDRKIGNVPAKFSQRKDLAAKLDKIRWNVKVPPLPVAIPDKVFDEKGAEDNMPDCELEEDNVHEEDLVHCWPEEEEALTRLNVVTLQEDEEEDREFQAAAAVAAQEKDSEEAKTKQHEKESNKRQKRSSVSAPPSMDPNDPNNPDNPRALRSRCGRVRREPVRLSYNHKDKDSVAMLYYQ